MANNTEQKIKELLGSGLSNEVVASSLGVSASYISQLMSKENFYNDVVELRTKSLAAHTVRDRNIDGIEDLLLDKLHEVINNGMVYKPNDLLRCFQVINAAKRRGAPAQESAVINNTVVSLRLPEATTLAFKTNRENEVIEVEGKTLVTMPSSALLNDLINKEGKDSEKYQSIQKSMINKIPLLEESSNGRKDIQNFYEAKHSGKVGASK